MVQTIPDPFSAESSVVKVTDCSCLLAVPVTVTMPLRTFLPTTAGVAVRPAAKSGGVVSLV